MHAVQHDNTNHSNVVVFDFDGTLMEGDAGKELLKALYVGNHLSHYLRIIFAMLILFLCLPWIIVHRKFIFTRVGTLLLWSGTFGLSQKEFLKTVQRVAASICRRNESGILEGVNFSLPATAYSEGFNVLSHAVKSGMCVVIITGSPTILVRKILKYAAPEIAAQVKIIGSRLSFGMGGVYTQEHCFRENKLHMANKAGVAVGPWKACYTDNVTDIPLLKNSDLKYLINASPKFIAQMKRAGIEDFESLNWSNSGI